MIRVDVTLEVSVGTVRTQHTVQHFAAGMAHKKHRGMRAPHILFILVDDLGHANIGFNRKTGSLPPEVRTQRIDALARSGLLLDRHYVYHTCTPSRAAFLSGRLPVHVTQKLYLPEQSNAGIPRNMTTIASVLKRAGYATHLVGKWDAGMATPTHTPQGRGFDSSLGYFGHKNDFWTKGIMQSLCLRAGAKYANLTDLWDTNRPAEITGQYEELTFRQRALSIIYAHKRNGALYTPLFLLYTPHVAHCPLQSPHEYIERFYPLTAHDDEGECEAQTSRSFCPRCSGPTPSWPPYKRYQCRALYSSMVAFLDESIGLLVDAMHNASLYDDSLIVLASDNGGPINLAESAANNWPLRGGKYSDFEGCAHIHTTRPNTP